MKIVFELEEDLVDWLDEKNYKITENTVPDALVSHIMCGMTEAHRVEFQRCLDEVWSNTVSGSVVEELKVVCRVHGIELHILLEPRT